MIPVNTRVPASYGLNTLCITRYDKETPVGMLRQDVSIQKPYYYTPRNYKTSHFHIHSAWTIEKEILDAIQNKAVFIEIDVLDQDKSLFVSMSDFCQKAQLTPHYDKEHVLQGEQYLLHDKFWIGGYHGLDIAERVACKQAKLQF